MKTCAATCFVMFLCLCPGAFRSNAQVVDHLEADVPFSFHAGMTTFPAGHYSFQVTQIAGTSTMEARSADGLYMALMEIQNVPAPLSVTTTKLVFTESNGRHFLTDIFTRGEVSGQTIVDVGYAKMYAEDRASGRTIEVTARRATP